MVYQETVFRRIQGEIERIGRERAKEQVALYLECLYSLDLDGRLSFYEQDRDGLPVRRVEAVIADGKPFDSTLLVRNILDMPAWRDIDKPGNFEGGAWPPWTRADLLGCKTLNEVCAECDLDGSYNDSTLDDDYFTWIERRFKFWHEHIDIRLANHIGYGLYARRHVPSRRYIGEYTGLIVPFDKELADEQTVYHFSMNIGKLQDNSSHKRLPKPTCWIDATKKGSIFRFMAHSCEPNAAVIQTRVGTHNRILAVCTIRPISPDEPIAIDYGDEWFTTSEQRCYCGTPGCKNPPEKDDGTSKDDSQTEYEE